MKLFEGYMTAVVTPFREDASLDMDAFRILIKRQKKAGIEGILLAGTTGESPALSLEERRMLFEAARQVLGSDYHLMAGVGSNHTHHTIELARHAEQYGADSLLVVTPYYNRPTQEGLYQHFKAVADAVSLPVCLYDVPSRTGARLSFETIERLSHHPNIAGIKDATGDLEQVIALSILENENFCQLGGEDALALPYFMAGGDGCISVSSNVAPELCVQMYHSWKKGQISEAQNVQKKLFPLHKAMFIESSPGPVKSALADMTLLKENLRLPLVNVTSASKEKIKSVLKRLRLLEGALCE